jgi:hypothetical protein
MAFPIDARQKKLTRQFPGEDIWKLIEQERIRDGADWLREEMASRAWSFETAERVLDIDGAHLWRVVQRQNRLSRYSVMRMAIKFGHVFDEHGNVTTDKIEYLVARFGNKTTPTP